MISILSPFIWALVVAYLLNKPMMFFQRLFEKLGIHGKWARLLAVVCAYASLLAILFFLVLFIVPQLIESISSLVALFPNYVSNMQNTVASLLSQWHISTEAISNFVGGFENLGRKLLESAGLISVSLLKILQSVTNGAMTFLLALLLSIYVLYGKETFIRQSKMVVYWLLPESKADLFVLIMENANMKFSTFINSKLFTSFLIGLVLFLLCLVFGVPYGLLLSLIMGISNLVPFFGPIVGTILCVLLLLVFDPPHVLLFLIAALILQAIEGNILVPWLCGSKMGLPAFWVMFGIVVGGGLFGIVGMFLGVPVMAVLYSLCTFVIEIGLEDKRVDPDKTNASP